MAQLLVVELTYHDARLMGALTQCPCKAACGPLQQSSKSLPELAAAAHSM
jgi:hypothetical protein